MAQLHLLVRVCFMSEYCGCVWFTNSELQKFISPHPCSSSSTAIPPPPLLFRDVMYSHGCPDPVAQPGRALQKKVSVVLSY